MQEMQNWIERMFTWILVPASFYGAAGGIFRVSKRAERSWRQVAVTVLGGAVSANMVMPIIAEYAPDSWHYTLFFIVGYGGVELISRLYEAAAEALEKRIRERL